MAFQSLPLEIAMIDEIAKSHLRLKNQGEK
jgi:hypothetical protein